MPEERFDAIVVGSGFGGSVTACRLAEAGQTVLVLERGQPYPPGSFARTPHGMRTNFWSPEDGLFGLFDICSFSGLDVITASGLGGGSLIYANVMLRKDEHTFVREDVLDGGYEDWPLTRADLEPHYDRVEARQRPEPYPLGHQPYAATRKTLAMVEAANALGLACHLPEIAVRFAADGEDPAPGRPISEPRPNLHHAPRLTCQLCGECDVGCNIGAKNTLDFTYLSDAQHAGAVLRTCCEARLLEPRPGGDWALTYVQHLGARGGHREDLLDPERRSPRTVVSSRVILAAGAVGSPRLLLANRATLPGLSPQLGRRVSANGDAIGWIRDASRVGDDGARQPRYLDPSRGPVITASIDVPADRSPSGREFHIQDAGAPAFSEWMWRLQRSASQTLASRKFKMFIDLFVRHIHLRSIRDNQWKLHSPGPRTLAFDEGDAHAQENELANRPSLRGRLRLEFPVQGDRDVDRCPNGLLFHESIISCVP